MSEPWRMGDPEILERACALLEGCVVQNEPGRVDEELAELRGQHPDMEKAARLLGVVRDTPTPTTKENDR